MRFTRNLVLVLATAIVLLGAGIQLKTRHLGPAADRRAYLSGPFKRRHFGRSHLLLQFERPIQPQIVEELRKRGAVVIASVPENGLMVSARDDFSVEGLGIRWAGRLRPEDKISPAVAGQTSSSAPQAQTFLVEFHADVDPDDARAMVAEHNLMAIDHPDLLDNHLLVSGAFGDVSRLTEWDELAYVLPVSADLLAGNRVSGCAGAVTQNGAVANYVKVSLGWPAGVGGVPGGVAGGDGVEVKYVFGNLTRKILPSLPQSEILRAFQEWAKYGRLKFTPGADPSGPRTINIFFASGAHGDPYPFDGPGKVLAHTFYPSPPNPEPIAGDMHFDADEHWQVGADTDLFTVALHETGHALGLGHSDQPGAVMYPYYRLGIKLSADDIAGIQDLYGAPDRAAAAPRPALALIVQNPAIASFTTTAASMSFSGITANGTGEAQVTWRTDQNVSGSASGSANWSIASVALHDGANRITITAVDAAKQTASVTIAVNRQQTVISDRTPPSLSINSPASSISSSQSATITVRGTAADNVGVTSVTWSTSTGGSGVATGTTNWTAADIPLRAGSNTVTIRAFDAARNSSWRTVMIVRR